MALVIASTSYGAEVEVKAVRIGATPNYTRVVFDLDQQITYTLFVLKNPDRIVVDLRNTRLTGRIDTTDREDRVLQRVRSAPRNYADLRVVLDLKIPARPKDFSLRPDQEYGHRLVIDLYADVSVPAEERLASFSIQGLDIQGTNIHLRKVGYAKNVDVGDLAGSMNVERALQQALEELDAGNVNDGIRTLEQILAVQPENNRARLELAVAYYRVSEFDRAKQETLRVLQAPNIPDTVRNNVLDLLAIIELEQSKYSEEQSQTVSATKIDRHRWFGSIGTGGGYDDNINVGPDNSQIRAPDIAFFIPQKGDYFYTIDAGMNYTYLIPTVLHIGGRDVYQGWNSSVYYNSRSYFNESAFDLDILTLSTGLSLATADSWATNLDLVYDRFWFGGRDYVEIYGFVPTLVIPTSGEQPVLWTSRIEHRDYALVGTEGRDGQYYSTRLSKLWRSVSGLWSLDLGGELFRVNANQDQFSNDGYEVGSTVTFHLPQNFNIYGAIRFRETDYDGDDPFFGVRRDDQEIDSIVGVDYVHKNWTLGVNYRYTKANSNVPIFAFTRNQYAVSVVYRW